MAVRRSGSAVWTAIPLLLTGLPASANPTEFGESFAIPVFERIDQNGVDLLTGMLRITSPVISWGTEERRERAGLQWMGRGWTHIERPSIWRKDGDFTVNDGMTSEEFKGRTDDFAQKKPKNGATLSCFIELPANFVTRCFYRNRYGDSIFFEGPPASFSPVFPNHGQTNYATGNIGMHTVRMGSADRTGGRNWSQSTEGGYNARDFFIRLGNQSLKIITPNHNGQNIDEHYLRPKNTTQVIVDDHGVQWGYTINNNRRMTKLDAPGIIADVNYTYNDNGKVASVTTVDGTWTYVYTSPGDFGTTTATSPLGEVTFARYNRDRGYITEYRDALGFTTLYEYDSGDRLIRITYPEQNAVAFEYDARGNPLKRTQIPKPGGGQPIIETAGYETTCTNQVTCNRPRFVIDGRGNRTDYEYETAPNPVLTGRPTKITLPPAQPGGIRPETRNTYVSGALVASRSCITQASCAGTADEIVTTYDYGGTEGSTRRLFGMAVTSNGVTMRTCYSYDDQGRKVSETAPRAGIATCPATVVPALTANATPPTTPFAGATPTYPQ
jgi:YD repeat-containing protein